METKDLLQTFTILAGVLGTVAAFYSGFIRYRKEKQIDMFRENIKSLFSEKRDEVLGAVATLGIYKSRNEYEKNVIDVLINRLYGELDYDVTNAIADVLSQYNNADEFNYIFKRLIEINRNYFVQTYPIGSRKTDLETSFNKLNKELKEIGEKIKSEPGSKDELYEARVKLIAKRYDEIQQQGYVHEVKLKWHKVIMADTLGLLLYKAKLQNQSENLRLNFHQNDFNYAYHSGYDLVNSSFKNVAFGRGSLDEIKMRNVTIKDSTFDYSWFRKCRFTGGTIDSTLMTVQEMVEVVFEDVSFNDTFFIGVRFVNCRFKNCTGLQPLHFHKTAWNGLEIEGCSFTPDQIAATEETSVKAAIENSSMTTLRKGELLKVLSEISKPLVPAS